ncbi:MAG: membrane or secreted protein [Bacteroidota bacterium]|nr:membrane or secreted protein [Bacteroidota bacterium]
MKHLLFYPMFCILLFSNHALSQKQKNKNLVYTDAKGILRFTKGEAEAAFFGVNYTVPFAYGYRSHKALGADLEKAIDEDVYHFARLGLDAFRVHIWDTEITDSLGNLKENEHLRLFDYLINRLKERGIKIFLTPLAFWGNGYPEPDGNTGSFSSKWNKQQVLVTEAAIKAQENYLAQLLKHVNPYTKLRYEEDADIIAMEINNEPHHSGTKQQASIYIKRMVDAVKKSGWSKPVFYNISESPAYADAVANAAIDGVSFQWYPTGLVANRSLKGNYLPNVGVYKIPFGDTIAAYRNKAMMVYEFDAGDVADSYMYPAMARSFRTAGFQWATQFAYDPMATAYGNTEYQTHYLNLAYTPSKAISLLIASKVFHKLPRLKSYGTYPGDTLFDVFRVSYKEQLSEMNSEEEFYYSNSTATRPRDFTRLKHIAGVGSSPVVTFTGSGAYFLNKIKDGVWRLEVMPDAIQIRDPFEKASPKKEVTRIEWKKNRMELLLPELGNEFDVNAVNDGNIYKTTAGKHAFIILPGTYIISKKNSQYHSTSSNPLFGSIKMNEYVAPKSLTNDPYITHVVLPEVSAGKEFEIIATVVGVDTSDKISVELRNSSNKWKTLQLQQIVPNDYKVTVSADMVTPGVINYRIIVKKLNEDFFVFPGNHKGDPYAWDAFKNESWQTFVAAENIPLVLFDATTDKNSINIYNPDWRNNSIEYVTVDKPNELVLSATMQQPTQGKMMGFQIYFAGKILGRKSELNNFKTLVLKAKGEYKEPVQMKLALITKDAQAFSTYLTLTNQLQEIEIPLTTLMADSSLLLPRPYPGFLPLWFKSSSNAPFNLINTEKLQVSFVLTGGKPVNIQVESVYLKK